ncbi:MAG: histidine phosphatase family protein [Actinobacteria bacterium]|nr:histidine phosphatase family protein [Actinomycetota bacterium]
MEINQKVIFLIRHGNTKFNEKKLFRGHTDIPLDNTGILQAEKTAKFLQDIDLDIIYSSPLARAYSTAEIIKKHQKNNIELKIEESFTDLDFGEWEGKGYDEVRLLYPEIYNAWSREPFKTIIPSGEDMNAAQKRSWDALKDIVSKSDCSYLAIVTHRIICKLLILKMLDISQSGIWKVNQSPCCINIFEYNYGIFFVSKLNYNFHITNLKDGFFKID